MNHQDPPQPPDPNDHAHDATGAARGEHHSADAHFGQIISSVEGQLEHLNRVQTELDEQTLAVGERAREMAADGAPPSPVTAGDLDRRTQAVIDLEAALDAKMRKAREEVRGLIEEQEAFDAERDQWIAGRTHAESQLRSREDELAQLERELTEEREQLTEIAGRVAEERARLLKQTQDQQSPLEELAAATSRCDELAGSLARATERAERAEAEGIELAQEVEQERDAARAELEETQKRVAVLEQQLAESQSTPTDEAKVGSDLRMRAMQQKIAKLEALLAQEHPQLANVDEQSASQQQQLDDMRQKAQRLASVADHLRRRHYRLRKMRHLLKQARPRAYNTGPDPRRAAAAAEQHAEQVRQIESRRIDLGEKAAALADGERRMIRRWARARAVVIIGWISMVGAIAAASSWLLACQIAPPVRSASITLEARGRARTALTDEQGAAWRAWHTAVVSEESFRETIEQRLDERQIETYPDAKAIGERLESDLTFAAVDNDSLLLTLSGTDPDELLTLLDLVASTIVVESGRVLRKRSADAWATLGGAHVVLNPTPIADQRLPWAGGIFGALYMVLILLGVVIYKRLMRVKQEFDADGSLFAELKPISDGAVQKVNVI